jgi:hypothetical protein
LNNTHDGGVTGPAESCRVGDDSNGSGLGLSANDQRRSRGPAVGDGDAAAAAEPGDALKLDPRLRTMMAETESWRAGGGGAAEARAAAEAPPGGAPFGLRIIVVSDSMRPNDSEDARN